MTTFVYVISGDHGRQKIGMTDDPPRRIRELQTGSPYALKFEFVGETENEGAGPVEVEAHFMLNPHKSPGGDEWFTVPPDVAITAVMASAHRLGYRIKPVDPDALKDKSYRMVQRLSSEAGWAIWLIGMLVFFGIVAKIAHAGAGELRCDSPGVAQIIVRDLISKDPSAQELGLEVSAVRLMGIGADGRCIVWVETNRDVAIKYLFGYDHGEASLDMVDMMAR